MEFKQIKPTQLTVRYKNLWWDVAKIDFQSETITITNDSLREGYELSFNEVDLNIMEA